MKGEKETGVRDIFLAFEDSRTSSIMPPSANVDFKAIMIAYGLLISKQLSTSFCNGTAPCMTARFPQVFALLGKGKPPPENATAEEGDKLCSFLSVPTISSSV